MIHSLILSNLVPYTLHALCTIHRYAELTLFWFTALDRFHQPCDHIFAPILGIIIFISSSANHRFWGFESLDSKYSLSLLFCICWFWISLFLLPKRRILPRSGNLHNSPYAYLPIYADTHMGPFYYISSSFNLPSNSSIQISSFSSSSNKNS